MSRDQVFSGDEGAEIEPGSGKSRANFRLLTAVSAISWLLVLWVLNASRFLRPVADDYCIGVRGAQGPIGGFIQDFQSYSGFATPSFLTNLFVGVPLANGNLWIASSVTFIAAALAISLLAVSIFWVCGGLVGSRRLIAIQVAMLTPIAIVSWWTFLWFPLESLSESPMDNLAIGLTHWQNLNSAYVLPTALILGVFIWFFRASQSRSWWVTSATAVLGLAAGLMGPTFGAAALLFLFLLFCWSLLQGDKTNRRYRIDLGVAILAVILGLLIAYLSPGTQARANYYEAGETQFAPGSITGWIMAVLPDNLFLFGELILHWGSLVVVTLFLGIGFFANRLIPSLRTSHLLSITVGLVIFGVSLTSATIITDTFAYGAYWHSSSIAVVAFAACASFGAWVGAHLSTQQGSSIIIVAAFSLLVGSAAAIGSTLDLSTSIVEREKEWANGPASITGIIEDREVEWIRDCADDLGRVNPTFSR